MLTKDETKTIVCYGDSNTRGSVPGVLNSYDEDNRWPNALQKILGSEYEVINEGLSGRTLATPDAGRPNYCGIDYLPGILISHNPIDLIIIVLGTNEVKDRYNLEANDIAKNLETTIKLIQNQENLEKSPAILVVCPPSPITATKYPVREDMLRGPEIFKVLPGLFKEVADKYQCSYLNAGDFVVSSTVDGYHLDAKEHVKLAEVIGGLIKQMKW